MGEISCLKDFFGGWGVNESGKLLILLKRVPAGASRIQERLLTQLSIGGKL